MRISMANLGAQPSWQAERVFTLDEKLLFGEKEHVVDRNYSSFDSRCCFKTALNVAVLFIFRIQLGADSMPQTLDNIGFEFLVWDSLVMSIQEKLWESKWWDKSAYLS